ncbi:MAG TPA: YciI family protein [Micromonosporaceae bacterium]|nr:YciI family protein [Micromonosporaceae bacterium]
MYIVELAFSDDPDRLRARAAHRELLAELHRTGKVVMAGPFADDTGALLVLDVADEDEVSSILAADPYYEHPAVTVVRRLEWSPILR